MSRKNKKRPAVVASSSQLRLIGGQWRGRKLSFVAVDGLRPTPDRVRETLFNWLAPVVPGAVCLDLFAGSGALGLEALSRGAKQVAFVELSAQAAGCLRDNLSMLNSHQGQVQQMTAEAFLTDEARSGAGNVDIVFLDPPFRKDLLAPCIEALSSSQWLAEQAWVYIETGSKELLPALPDNWQLHREKNAGQVCYRLFRVSNSTSSLGLSKEV